MRKKVVKKNTWSSKLRAHKQVSTQQSFNSLEIFPVFNSGLKQKLTNKLFVEVHTSAELQVKIFIKAIEEKLLKADLLGKAKILEESLAKITRDLNEHSKTDPFKGNPLLLISRRSIIELIVKGQTALFKSNPTGNFTTNVGENSGEFLYDTYQYLLNLIFQIRKIESSCVGLINHNNILEIANKFLKLSDINKIFVKNVDSKFDDSLLSDKGDKGIINYFDELTELLNKLSLVFSDPIRKLQRGTASGEFLFRNIVSDLLELTEVVENIAGDEKNKNIELENLYNYLFPNGRKELIQQALCNHLKLSFITKKIKSPIVETKVNNPTLLNSTEIMEVLNNMSAIVKENVKALNRNNALKKNNSVPISHQLVWINSKIDFEEEMNRLINEGNFSLERVNDVENKTAIMNILKSVFNVVEEAKDFRKSKALTIPYRLIWEGGYVRDFAKLFNTYINKTRAIYFTSHTSPETEPIVDILSQIFLIKKKKGKGYMEPSSLLTNFKQTKI